MGHGIIPRHQFILWLAVQQRLATVDRLSKWGISVPKDCVLCNTGAEENFTHLFFDCPYSNYMWQSLLHWMQVPRQIQCWHEEVAWISRRAHTSRPRAEIVSWLFAACIYHVWIERNARRFSHRRTPANNLLKDIGLQLHIRGQLKPKWRGLELEEARKASLAPAELDEDGKEISPHIPQYMSSAPWYLNAERP
ncbi:uncharacterized protein LOC132042397, partial [Lycium ferocissimum]|uniref:uncharacterized protein LOC132042397 n=1 Tax=Lycium ferocissimum TaxID=112874 RepID=UPI00281681AD